MNVVVCVKQVPGTIEVKIDPQTNTLVREGVKGVINPLDAYALEEGVRLKERYGGKVTVITMGPPQAEESLREAISLGADEAVLVSDRAFAGSDTLATAYVLARAIEKLGLYDLVLCGRQTLDGDTGQVGPEMSERMGLPFVAYVSNIEEVEDGRLRARRMVEDGYETVEMFLPGLITVVKEINVPRLPSLRGMMKAKSAQIPVWGAVELEVDIARVGTRGSPTWVEKIFFPQRVRRSEMLQGKAEDQVEQLLEKLRDMQLV
ncbi:MAG: electron transfer flavoprotein subunit beta/FixA family protein [Chloroflexota bacterium]